MRLRRKQQMLNKAFDKAIARLSELLESDDPKVVLQAVTKLERLQNAFRAENTERPWTMTSPRF